MASRTNTEMEERTGVGSSEASAAAAPLSPPKTLVELAMEVLETADPAEKARLGDAAAIRWLQGEIPLPYREQDPPHLVVVVPDRPARPSSPRVVASHLMPKLGKAGSLQSRLAILHSLAHTESWAIDLSWDIIARFGRRESMPREFFTDFVRVAQDEGRHFTLIAARLKELGSFYGALPAHDGLWDSAMKTCHDLLARLAIEHCVHEARGLDVLPTTIRRLREGGDETSANLLETVVYPEEITHCAAGVKWFKYLSLRSPPERLLANAQPEEDSSQPASREGGDGDGDATGSAEPPSDGSEADDGMVIQAFHSVVRMHFRGPLKPPFNEEARRAAGFGPNWYEPLSVKWDARHDPDDP